MAVVINKLADLQRNNVKLAEYLEKRLAGIIALEKSQFVFTNLGVEKTIPMKQGTKTFTSIRHKSLPVDMTKALLVEGVPPVALLGEKVKVSGTVSQYGAYMIETDVAEAIDLYNLKTVYQPELSRHAAEVIERNVIANLVEGSEYYCGTGNTAKADLLETDVLTIKDLRLNALTMKNFRRNGHTKFNRKPVTVVHTNVMQDLLDDDAIEKKLLVPGNENAPIKIGTLEKYMAYGMYFMETLIAPVESVTKSGGGLLNVYTSYMLGENPYMVLSLESQGVKFYNTGFTAEKTDPLGQTATIGYKLWAGAKVIDPMAITRIYSASAFDIVADFTNDTYGSTANQTQAV